jgi:hypothetical protein
VDINSTTGILNVDKGGTGQTTYTIGQLLIGTNGGLAKGALLGTLDRIIVQNDGGNLRLTADATAANSNNKIVARDSAGNFSAGTITATLDGTATTANATAQSVTFNNGGAGAASGITFNGSIARTISYNTIGAPSTTGTNASGTWSISITGNAATATSAGTATTAGNVTGIVAVANGGTGANNATTARSNLGAGTVSSVAAGLGMNFTTITGTGTITLGNPSTLTATSTNSVGSGTHNHALATDIGRVTVLTSIPSGVPSRPGDIVFVVPV